MRRLSARIVLLTCLGALLAGCGVNLPDHTPSSTAKQSSAPKAG